MQLCFIPEISKTDTISMLCDICGCCLSDSHIIVIPFLIVCLSVYVSNSRYRATLLL